MSNHDKAKEHVRRQFGDDVDLSPGTTGYAIMKMTESHLDKLDALRRELDLASWPSVDHANALLRASAAEHARLVAEGMPPLKPHEILAVFREAGCLYERSTSAGTLDLVRDYFAALDAWNGQDGGRGEQEGRLNKAENELRDAVGVTRRKDGYR